MRPKNILILIGGQGTRLKTISKSKPKCLVNIRDKPFLFHLLESINRLNIDNVYLCTGYGSNQVESYINSIKSFFKFSIIISKEEKPLGTGGAILNAIKNYNLQSFIALNGDTLLSLDKMVDNNLFDSNYIFTKRMFNTDRYGSVITDKDNYVISFDEKKYKKEAYISIGAYHINTELFDFQADKYNSQNISMEYDIIPRLISEKKLKSYQYDDIFLDIGIPSDWKLAQTIFI